MEKINPIILKYEGMQSTVALDMYFFHYKYTPKESFYF